MNRLKTAIFELVQEHGNITDDDLKSKLKKKKPEEPLGQSQYAQEMQRQYDANIGQIQYEKAAGIGEFETSRPQAGAIMNQMMLEKIGGGNGAGAAAGPTIVDAKTVNNNVVNNNIQNRSPSPSGQYMFAERGDFVGIRKIA